MTNRRSSFNRQPTPPIGSLSSSKSLKIVPVISPPEQDQQGQGGSPDKKPAPLTRGRSVDSVKLRSNMSDISKGLPLRDPPLPIHHQPRGGTIVETCCGNVQFGMPPETIKDCLSAGLMVPQYFVVPTVSFVRQLGPNMGINVAEFEFPTYCNFFFYRRKVTLIVASTTIEKRIREVFQETLYGPEDVDVSIDFVDGTPPSQMPDMKKELDFFRVFDGKYMQLEDLLEFIVFDDNGLAVIEKEDGEGNKKMVKLQWKTLPSRDQGEYVVIEDDHNCATIPDDVVLPLPPTVAELGTSAHFDPPVFGLTVLGNSHGFDPSGKTSGYVLWLNKRGYMIGE